MNKRHFVVTIVSVTALIIVIGVATGKVGGGGVYPPVTAVERACAFQQTRIHLDNPLQRMALAFGRLDVVDRTRRDFTVVARTAFGIPFAAVTVYNCPGDLLISVRPTPALMNRYARIVEIFTTMRIGIARAVGMPEGGYLPSHLIGFYPGLEPRDFDGAEAEGGVYHLTDGMLIFDPWAEGAEAFSNEGASLGTLGKFDMGRIFDAVRERTGVDWEAEGGTQAFIEAISATDGNEEDVILHDADGVRVSERPRASSRYHIGNIEGTVEFRDMMVETGSGDPIVIPYEVAVVGLTSVRSVSHENIVLAYGDGFSKMSEFWVVDRVQKDVRRYEARPHFGQWLAVMPDGGILYRTTEAIVLADATWHQKKTIPFKSGENVVVATALTDDENRIALVTWNGAYESSEARYMVHVADLETGDIVLLGEAPETNSVTWDADLVKTGWNSGRTPTLLSKDVTATFRHEKNEESEHVKTTITAFLDLLHQKDYSAAADLYAGDYEVMASWNPDIASTEHVDLWRRACEENGLNCLRKLDILGVENIGDIFSVHLRLRASDGTSAFVRGACCGSETNEPAQQVFSFTVKRFEDGYKVLTPPPYTP